ncbi:MAG: HdeD family acid-resistance protein [Ruminococcus sp.]
MDKKSTRKKNIFNKEKSAASTAIIASLAYMVLGFIMMLFPESIRDVLCYTLGIVLTVYGLFNIISFFINKEFGLYFELIVGVLATAFGIFTLFSPSIIVNIIFVTIGIIIIIDSLMDIKHSFQLKALGMKYWWICTAVSVSVIILGLCTIFFPSFFGEFLIFLLGIIMIYEGISGLSIIGLFSHYSKKRKDNKMIDVDATDVY